jgi:ABC-type multidrug transport system fused ATPase/permease subunit
MVDPVADVGAPDLRSPLRFLIWIAAKQRRIVVGGAIFGILWMCSQAAIPAALGAAVQAIADGNRSALVSYSLVILGLGIVQSVAGILRHRRAVMNFITAACRVEMLVARQAAYMGADLARHVAAGEIANIGANDVERIGECLDVTARFAGAIVAYTAVATVLLVSSVELGLVLVIGAPVIAAIIGPLMRPLERRQSIERDVRNDTSNLAADTVVGLRVLRGLGGEETFIKRFRKASQSLRKASVRTAKWQSNLDALQIVLPGLLLVVVTWLGARLVVEGSITPGRLVAFYAYTAFLVLPMRTITEMASKWTAGTVAARRVISLLERRPDVPEPATAAPTPASSDLVDEVTGLRIEAGKLTVVASTDPAAAGALVDRLGRYTLPDPPDKVRLGGVSLADLPAEDVRERILVVTSQPVMLAGTVREMLDPPASEAGTGPPTSGSFTSGSSTQRGAADPVEAALEAASARDVIDGLADGLDTELPERGRTLSGGQRQRLVLAQAMLADPEVLVLDEPTSAVDAHTEAAIAGRLRAIRGGRTTVVFSTSPLLLEQADEVVLLDGAVQASGDHADLMTSCAPYQELVTRGMAE